MDFWIIILIALGLSMDAFAVSICKGLSLKKANVTHALMIGLCFGLFQAVMPIIGYGLGRFLSDYADKFDHWIGFGLLVIIGIKMIKDATKPLEENPKCDIVIKPKELIFLGIATSIDALAIGITLAFTNTSIWFPALMIGLITFGLAFLGTLLGKKIGSFLERKAEVFGGIILVLIGIKILVDGLHLL